MALDAAITWEVRSGGHADNGGGFKTGSSGTDRSQSDSAFVTFNGASPTATTSGASATITITGYTVVSGDVGNVVKITGGTNFTTGYYEITSVNTGANTWTFDRTCTSGNGSGMTGRMGGGTSLIGNIVNTWVAGNTIYMTGSFTQSSSLTISTNATQSGPIRIIGYTSTRTDGGQATMTSGANSITLFGLQGIGYSVQNIKLVKAGGNTNVEGFLIQNARNHLINCRAESCTTNFAFQGAINAIKCVSVNGTNGFDISASGSTVLSFCEAYNASSVTFKVDPPAAGSVTFNYCIAVDSAGYGFHIRDNGCATILNCTAYSCGNSGFYVESWNGTAFTHTFINCISSENTGYGFIGISSAVAPRVLTYNCATYSNSSGATSNTTNSGLITLSADPFVTKTPGAGTGDYDLNNTSGGGALLRQLGYPSTMGYYTATTPLLNVGAGGFAASAGGTTTNVIIQKRIKVR